MRFDVVLFAEECVERGGIGQQLTACLCQLGWQGRHGLLRLGGTIPG